MFADSDLKANYCRMRISPDITIAIGANAIAAGQPTSPLVAAVTEGRSEVVEMLFTHTPGPEEMDAYERLLGDALEGDATLFAREDYVEEAWRIVEPVLRERAMPDEYEPGTWGPKAPHLSPPGGWQDPKVTS
jgi:glucose-6-phosphate 1-dehydrogenase